MENKVAGVCHLADNEAIVHYNEGLAEKLECWLKKYKAEAKQGMEKDLVTWVASMSKHKKVGFTLPS